MTDFLNELDRRRVAAARGTGRVRLSLRDLAEATKVPRSSLANYLSGATLMPSDVLEALVRALGAGAEETRRWITAWERAVDQRSHPVVTRPSPHLLPAVVPGFCGRADELTALDGIVTTAGAQPVAMVTIVLTGTAGVGKTALAVHWGHRVADRFPDGQIYLNLRGYDLAEPMSAEVALGILIRALGGETIPADPDERGALYRDALAGRRMLIVLDNARSAEQVRPLLPGTAGHVVVVTSRDSMSGLVAREGAHRLVVDRLSQDEAADLLGRFLSTERASAEPKACAELNVLCAGLPLTLRVAAERIVHHPHATLSALVGELRSEERRLDLLDAGGDRSTDARVVFSWSYHALPPAAARLFRLLGLAPGVDFDAYSAANLADLTLVEAQRLLSVLHRGCLIEEPYAGRYALHDLLRVYAGEQVRREDGAPLRSAAFIRLLDWYAHTVHAATDKLEWFRPPFLPPIEFAPVVPMRHFTDVTDALAWLDAERGNLVPAIRQAEAEHSEVHAWRISHALAHYFFLRGYGDEWLETHHLALGAAVRADDALGAAVTMTSLAAAHSRRGDNHTALDYRRQALSLYQRIGFGHGETVAHVYLGDAYFHLGRLSETQDHCQQALELSRESNDMFGEVLAQWGLARVYSREGRYGEALKYQHDLLDLARQTGGLQSQALTEAELATTYLLMGDYAQALTHYEQALVASRQVGDRPSEIMSLTGIGNVRARTGHYLQAVSHHEQALQLSERLYAPNLICQVLNNLADTHQATGDHHPARSYRGRALTLAEQIGNEREAARAKRSADDTW
ncbi:ATP-binding protein [Nonomuraea guangzhouensis]|uniref:ATP-binding protein n=1 Tax=Nonomuraea guangzhouensis TaxID=1291555 RepID=A0ABW4GA68_9ACTN|nr:tetratricopeptide repeat protein [Nonomuraea guangzhouensis]